MFIYSESKHGVINYYCEIMKIGPRHFQQTHFKYAFPCDLFSVADSSIELRILLRIVHASVVRLLRCLLPFREKRIRVDCRQ